MSKDTAQEKTEQATPHRLQKALEEGKVFKSQELSSVGVLSLGFLALYALGPMVVNQTTDFMRHIFREAPLMSLSQTSLVAIFRDGVANFFLTIGPFLVIMV
ncbi:MAG TPA: EscU/YscU/HrcU family type III secretion system export apparatus switch protein, partial [candidate division Zixibacteria bacterium]|nr:EscU/YscU/HrcU family type III secretion system export apparatus switch protein [candidate division Zixibacteria bacterium]